MKKFAATIMILSLFGAFTAQAQDAAKPAEAVTTTTTVTTTTPTDPTKAAETTAIVTTKTEEPKANEKTDQKKTENNQSDNTLIMELKYGKVVIQLLPEVAPNHVKRIKELVRQKFYDNVPFHRVIDGFMAQTGDPTGTGTGGSGTKIDAEFNATKHVRGTVSMARAADPNSADSQFFIVFAEAPHLDGNYTAFGKVIEGMEFVDKIKKGNGPNGMVSDPDKIITLRVASDIENKPADAAPKPAADGKPAAEPAKK